MRGQAVGFGGRQGGETKGGDKAACKGRKGGRPNGMHEAV